MVTKCIDKIVSIWTNGYCDPMPNFGGYAALLSWGVHRKMLSGAIPHTTLNRMKLTPAIIALEALKHPCNVVLFSDSQYVVGGCESWARKAKERRWRGSNGKPFKNADLWERLLVVDERHAVEYVWMQRGSPESYLVDELARRCAVM